MNENKHNGRDARGHFLPGNSASPGRPKGSRNLLAERFLRDVYSKWKKHGADVLERVIHDDPTAFAKIVAHILPREIDSTLSMNVSLFSQIEDFNQAYSFALKHIGAEIEAEAEPELIEANGNNGTD